MNATARNTGKRWTDEADAALIQMWTAAEKPQRICALLGRSELAIATRLALLGEFPDTDEALLAVQRRAND